MSGDLAIFLAFDLFLPPLFEPIWDNLSSADSPIGEPFLRCGTEQGFP